ncbi:MAG: DNA-formamidopyrimidine glycosylase family protein [Polyangiaceae bacterium]
MPELPDVTVYVEHLATRLVGRTIMKVRVASPFVVRTFDPPVSALEGKRVDSVRRLGKRIVFGIEGGMFLVVHLMVAGRFKWKPAVGTAHAKLTGKIGLFALDVAEGTLELTEASTKKRASVHVVRGEEAVRAFDRGGVEPLGLPPAAFAEVVTRENRTLKRLLTDPRIFSGVGNAYSDEILHAAKLSPLARSAQLGDDAILRLQRAMEETLTTWTDRLRVEAKDGFPEKVTAFRPEMAVHGRYGKPCPVCGSPVQRIVYAENEANYCATCQTEGRLLADRAFSRLLREDWPKTLDELELAIEKKKAAARDR